MSDEKISKRQKQYDQKAMPWYCEYKTSHRIYRFVIDTFWNCFPFGEGVAYILDIFITFFTGDFHPVTEVLIPKPFFNRWILPGLVLQLLANPFMEGALEFLYDLVAIIVDLGPIRVWRGSRLLCFP
jgi:hypothetical protein